MNKSLNILFDKIFVLTIHRNLERHSLVNRFLDGVDFEFWYGLDGVVEFPDKKYVSELPDKFFEVNNLDKNYVSRYTRGQLGAYASIKNMIEYVAEKDFTQALIFEDDFIPINADWQMIINRAIKELPSNWDILLLGYDYQGTIYKLAYNRRLRWIVRTWDYLRYLFTRKNLKVLPVKFSKSLDTSGLCYGGHAYCISKKGANYLSKLLSPMKDSGDILVSKLITAKKINAYSVYPCLFLQNTEFQSKTKVI